MTLRFGLVSAVMVILAIILGAMAPLAVYADGYGSCNTSGQTALSSDTQGFYLCDGANWRWVNADDSSASYLTSERLKTVSNIEQQTAKDDPGEIGEPWSFEIEASKAFNRAFTLFGSYCTNMTIDLIIVTQPHPTDSDKRVTLAETLQVTKTHSLMWFYPIFFVLDDSMREKTLLHEFGHACGLDHSTDKRSIMYPLIDEIEGPGIVTAEEQKTLEVLWKPRFRTFIPAIIGGKE